MSVGTVLLGVATMPAAPHQGGQIHDQVEGQGPPRVLQHGVADSLESWDELGSGAAVREDYQLSLVDARGHGARDQPHDPEAYRLRRRVGDMVAVLETRHLTTASCWGDAMGGWIGFGRAASAPARVRALISGGQHPYGRTPEAMRPLMQRGRAQGPAAFGAGMDERFGALDEPYTARLLTAALEAFRAMPQERPGLAEVLPPLRRPCGRYVGEQDPGYPAVQACRQQIPQVTLVSLPGLTQAAAFIRSDLVLPEVRTFLQAVPREEVRGLPRRKPAGSWRARQEPPRLRGPRTSARRLTVQSLPSGAVSVRHLRPPSRSRHSASPKATMSQFC